VLKAKTAVVFVHGLWLTGAESLYLRRCLAKEHGFECHSFRYPTIASSMNDIVDRLVKFVGEIEAERVHFVGHSLGGLVLYRYFEREKNLRPGRVVFLGSPAVKSKTAETVGRIALLAPLIGRMVAEELVLPCKPREWRAGAELGCIAGTRPMGLGRFFANFDEECDGTVAVSETKLPGAHAHVQLPVSHMGMLLSARVAKQCGAFLATGRFETA
jgi:pimeloyl-ACP methyl ester carboxylesterase